MIPIENAIVETKYGKLKGTNKDGLYIFKGIPYAAPPIGDLRWMPPSGVKPWKGIRSAVVFGPVAPQNKRVMKFRQESALEEPHNEDCLYLNIWSPGLDTKRRPVMIWIHGGAFNSGSGSNPTYSGFSLSRCGDAVIITINYRLGALGFLHLDTITGGRIPATGNEGLLDQIAALRWVKENIEYFGGNPDNITIFGESAGAMSIGCLLAMPQAHDLFHKAILQSGSNTVKSLNESVNLSKQFLRILGLDTHNIDAIRSIPVNRLLNAQQQLALELNIKGSVMEPVIDGKVLPEMPIAAIMSGSAAKVAIMVGTNLEEAKFMAVIDPGLTNIDDEGLVKRWQKVLPADLVSDLIVNYRKALSKDGLSTNPSDIALALQTDRQFRVPAIRLVEAQRKYNQNVFSYLFTWKSPNPDLGSCHTLDIGFVFGILSSGFHGNGPKSEVLSGIIQDAWLAFARTGNPSCSTLGIWPQCTSLRETMILGEKCHVKESPYEEELRAWNAIPTEYLG